MSTPENSDISADILVLAPYKQYIVVSVDVTKWLFIIRFTIKLLLFCPEPISTLLLKPDS